MAGCAGDVPIARRAWTVPPTAAQGHRWLDEDLRGEDAARDWSSASLDSVREREEGCTDRVKSAGVVCDGYCMISVLVRR